MGSSFEVLYEDDLKRFFDSQKYEQQIERMGDRKREIHEAICKCFINGLTVNGSNITNIYEDEIEDIYDLKIGRYVIHDLYTFNLFSNNDKAVEFFHDFLRDERFEKIDDVLYQIAEERFDWFTEQKKGLYGGKVYNIDASLSMSAPMSAKEEFNDEFNDEYNEEYLAKETLKESFNQLKIDFKQFSSDMRGINLVIYESPFEEKYFDILRDKIHLYEIKLKDLFLEEAVLRSAKDLEHLYRLFLYRIGEMAQFVINQKEEYAFREKNQNWSKKGFAIEFDHLTRSAFEVYSRLSIRIQRILEDDLFDKSYKFNRFEKQPASFERAYSGRLRGSYQDERTRRTQLNNNFFNYFLTPGLKINFYGDAFDNKFLVNRVHYHRKNIETVVSAYDGILND